MNGRRVDMELIAPDFLRLTSSCVASRSDWWLTDANRSFGGQIIAFSLVAASRKSPKNFSLHSLHLHFLRPGRCVDTHFVVEEVRAGRTYAVYRCMAVEYDDGDQERLIAISMISFCRAEPSPSMHADRIPLVTRPPPPGFSSKLDAESSWPRTSQADDSGCMWYMTWAGYGAGDGAGNQLSAESSPIAHAAALAFLSDHQFLWAGFVSNSKCYRQYDHVMSASLDHVFYLHEPSFDASGLLLYETESPWLASGRTFVRGKIWSVDSGKLIASTVQEAVFRVRPKSKL